MWQYQALPGDPGDTMQARSRQAAGPRMQAALGAPACGLGRVVGCSFWAWGEGAGGGGGFTPAACGLCQDGKARQGGHVTRWWAASRAQGKGTSLLDWLLPSKGRHLGGPDGGGTIHGPAWSQARPPLMSLAPRPGQTQHRVPCSCVLPVHCLGWEWVSVLPLPTERGLQPELPAGALLSLVGAGMS